MYQGFFYYSKMLYLCIIIKNKDMKKETLYQFENVEDIKKFIVGGNAIFTLESKITGNWFTYKIKKMKDADEKSPLFVYVLTGSDNEGSYTYMGSIFNYGKLIFKLTPKSKIKQDALSYKAFSFFFNLLMLNQIHKDMGIYHKGICAICGRTLTTPESLKNGIGSTCAGIISTKNSIKNKKSLSYSY